MTRDDVFHALETNLRTQLTQAGVPNAGSLRILGSFTPREIGGHSLEIMEAIYATARQLHVDLPREDLLRTRTIDDVLNVFARALHLP